MSDEPTSKPMAMLLQDPYLRDDPGEDDQGEYLHEDYQFLLDKDSLVGMGSSKFVVRDPPDRGDGLDWRDTALAYEDFKERASSRSIVDDPQFRQVNAFAVASHTLQTIEEALDRKITWRNGRPIVIRTHAPEAGGDAYYDPFSSSLNFGFREPSEEHAEGTWTCLSHDFVSHEVGHAVWDSFRPLFVYSGEMDTQALQESFGDLTALFSKLEHPKLVKRLYEDLLDEDGEVAGSSSNFYNRFIYAGRGNPFDRRHLNPETLRGRHYDPQKPKELYKRSSIWTGAICDILDELRKETLMLAEPETRKGSSDHFTHAVVSASNRIRQALLRALHYVPHSGVTMPLLARLFCEADTRLSPNDSTIRNIAKGVFEKRNLRVSDIRLDSAPSNIAPAWVAKFEEAYMRSDSALCTQMVIEQAQELRIPLDERPRMLAPRLIRANGEIYLSFAYELVGTVKAPIYEDVTPNTRPKDMILAPTGKEEIVTVPSYYGGTVVLDEKVEKDGILVSDLPPATMTQPARAAGAKPHTDERNKSIGSQFGYMFRHRRGQDKIPGFVGFDWPEPDEQRGVRTMTNNEEGPRDPEGLEPDPIVEQLVPDPSESAVPAIALEGLLGRSPKDGYRRLYFTIEFKEYAEFREEDVLHREPMEKEHPPFVGLESTRLWVKPNAQVTHTRTESRQVQASFLTGDIETGLETGLAAGTTAGPLDAEAAEFLATVTNTLACRIGSRLVCPPTAPPGCASLLCCRTIRFG
jgi:hypothetical protein